MAGAYRFFHEIHGAITSPSIDTALGVGRFIRHSVSLVRALIALVNNFGREGCTVFSLEP